MISIKKVKKFCKDYTKIENYEEAVNDPTQVWDCHHILGEILTSEQLKDHDFYYDVPPCMLKFLTHAEHRRLHMKGKHLLDETRKKMSEARKGKKRKPFTEEHRRKISEANKGRTFTEEWRRNISESCKGRHHSEETCKKISDAKKGRTTWSKGKHLSEEHRRKLSEAAKRRCARKRESISHHELA